MSAEVELDAMLADLAQRVQAVRDFQCQHGLERSATRNLPRRMIRLARHWRKEIAAEPGTMCDSVVAIATAQRVGPADTSSSPSADEQEQRCQ
jgi:hypothetical protein